jgi:hypothetical protein
MTPIFIAHSLSTRTRLKLPKELRNEANFEALEFALYELPGVLAVEFSPLTGSILVQHTEEAGQQLRTALTSAGFGVNEGTPQAAPYSVNWKEVIPALVLALVPASRLPLVPYLVFVGAQIAWDWRKGKKPTPATLAILALEVFLKVRRTGLPKLPRWKRT